MPILTTLKDAFTVFEKTEMDTLIVEDKYIRKYMKL
jgi:predicted NodU family carbamoyl transferase